MNNLIKIDQPAVSKELENACWNKALSLHHQGFLDVMEQRKKTESPTYLHWTELKRKSWLPAALTPQEFWACIKHYRYIKSQPLPLRTPEGKIYKWTKAHHYDRILHELDMDMGGRFFGPSEINEHERYRYISHSMIEEAIASAQLEGAHTTRAQAIKMIRENRTPVDNSQRMIFNNYRAMQKIEAETKDRTLDMDALLDLHRLLTHNTMKTPDEAGRLRRDDENIVVSGQNDTIAHIPPPVAFVKQELQRLFDWANDVHAEKEDFIHPLVKAIMLHFWIGYLHPFTDGNGRLARALFYWYLLKKGYTAFAFIPISTRIKKSPAQYGWAYIYSEQDDEDATYFIDYNLKQIQLARRDFEVFITRTLSEKDDVSLLGRKLPGFNDRQIQLILYFKKHPAERANVTSVRNVYGVTAATAVKDLKGLTDAGYLTFQRRGRNVFYYPTERVFQTE